MSIRPFLLYGRDLLTSRGDRAGAVIGKFSFLVIPKTVIIFGYHTNLKNGIWILIAAAAIWVLTKVKAGMSLRFIPRSVDFDGANFIVRLGIANDSMFPISFHSFSGNILINGQDAGLVTDFMPQTVVANGETVLPLTFQPKILSIANDIVNFLKTGSPQNITIKGIINVENISLPINQTFTAGL